LEEQLAYISVPSLTSACFVEMECTLGLYLKSLVMEHLVSAGQEKQLAIANNSFEEGMPAITVIVDSGWSQRAHKHSYNAKSGVAVILKQLQRNYFSLEYVISTALCVQ